MIVCSQDLGGGFGKVDRLAPQTSVLAASEGEQRLEQSYLALAGGGHGLAHLTQGGRPRIRVCERRLRDRELDGDFAAKLVRGIGEETLLRIRHAAQLISAA